VPHTTNARRLHEDNSCKQAATRRWTRRQRNNWPNTDTRLSDRSGGDGEQWVFAEDGCKYSEQQDGLGLLIRLYDGLMGHLVAMDCLRMITSKGVSLVEIISLALDCTQLYN
jgi:hypothetical protein